jgi:hypothetical protein
LLDEPVAIPSDSTDDEDGDDEEPVLAIVPDYYDEKYEDLVMEPGQEDTWWEELKVGDVQSRMENSGDGDEQIVCQNPNELCVVAFLPVSGT